ncbi:chorion class B protein PC10-like [Manduca sexta]|uniref:chorion class B protein PC10-like n=1 Tax=Manduca sexta TaxID=7130 RepID=UPI0018904F4C|nr:chorion class B protein PC10-like [Manduca sexta]
MAAKILLICASALFVQSAMSNCLGRIGAGLGSYGAGWGYDGLAYDGLAYGAAWPAGRLGCGAIGPIGAIAPAADLAASYGGGLPVATGSPIAPTGLAVASENVYEGPVAVAGNLPFLGTVAVEGVFPTAGAGAVSYGCGDGAIGITAEGPIGAYGPAAIAPAGIAPALGYGGLGLGYGVGYAGRLGGCGCGAIY